MKNPRWPMFAAAFAALIGLSLAYNAWKASVSITRATFLARYAKCGPTTNSGPHEISSLRGVKRYAVMARLDDGRLISVERKAAELPACGATLTIAERITPWGTVWYWTEQ